jgi:hypothetical protein
MFLFYMHVKYSLIFNSNDYIMENKAFEHELSGDFYLKQAPKFFNNNFYNLTTSFADLLNDKKFLTDLTKEKRKLNAKRVSTSSLLNDSDPVEFNIDDDSLYIERNLNHDEFYDVNSIDSFDEEVDLLKKDEYTLHEKICICEAENMDVSFVQIYRNKQKNK